MSWRPKEGWENPHYWPRSPSQGMLYEIFEAGADALLEALKERGEKVEIPWNEALLDKEGVLEKAAHYLGIPLDGTCWLVAITDEEEKFNVMCSYCQRIVEVDKSTADVLDGTTAFCCKKCAGGDG